ncbi:MAG: 50S ribosomal protein L10 [Sphingobacteriales bacterium]|nr:MAG: 50S ribosomal protein L10 [Sphingobacteriales bacterium]
MRREGKAAIIEELKEKFGSSEYFYLADSSTLTVEEITKVRRIFYSKGLQLKVAKNTLIKKALDQISESKYTDIYSQLHGPTTIIFTETSNLPAKAIQDLQNNEKMEGFVFKAAYIDSAVFVGEENLETLTKLKSKFELLGEVIGILQSPAKNVISALKSGGDKLAGIVKTLSEKE